MASLVCKYCGSYLNDTDEICPECGAVNDQYKRVVDGTPRTIEELKSWYKARNLPDENITRFFIGKNIKQPRAFGIYEENGKFIVYKNKGNRQRAIRYEGRDEAYAVNELYLRLKEEILNQKKQNERKNRHSKTELSDAEYKYYTAYAQRKSKQAARQNQQRNPSSRFSMALVILLIICTIVPLVSLFGMLRVTNFFGGPYYYNDYYLSADNNLYYLEVYDDRDKEFVWWAYDDSTQEWSLCPSYSAETNKKIVGPFDVQKAQAYDSVWDFAEANGKDGSLFEIQRSPAYIDAGHHVTPSTSYYEYNDKLYYFLDDNHSSYGDSDNSGWYVYENDTWNYFCSENDKKALGDDLWYYSSDYYIGSDYEDIYSFTDEYSTYWNVAAFEDTSWYSAYESNNSAYQSYLDSQSSYDDDYDWSSDDDWDWDSGSDWDSGGSDWDSDW